MTPGAGVVGQGGRQDPTQNITQMSHAAGMIAMAGAEGKPLPPLAITGGLGLWAKGGDAEITMVPPFDSSGTIPGPLVPSGPLNPGRACSGSAACRSRRGGRSGPA